MTDTDAEAKSDAADAFEKLGVCRQLAVAAAELGWKTPTSIQEQAVPHLLAGEPGNATGWQATTVFQDTLLLS